jgi:LysR family hydrogen peroxide-inducible transcriptional activator
MTLTELRYIIAVAREHHFGRAAKACFVSQPTLSVAIKKLEDELGVAIFERGSNEVSLSPIGERIVQQAQQTLESADNIKQLAQHGQNQLSGALRIGAIHTIGPYLYPALIPLLRKAAPDMPLVVEEDFTAGLTEKLKNGELDVIIIALPYKEQGIVTKVLHEEPFVVLLPASHPLTSHKTISSRMLEKENVLLLGRGHCFRDHVLDACPACIPKPGLEGDLPHAVEGSSLETIRHMVVSGLGVTVLPCTAAATHSYSKRLLTIRCFGRPTPTRTVALAWRVSFPRPRVIDVISKAVRDCNLSCVKPVKRRKL